MLCNSVTHYYFGQWSLRAREAPGLLLRRPPLTWTLLGGFLGFIGFIGFIGLIGFIGFIGLRFMGSYK